jgi:hypothetical protein
MVSIVKVDDHDREIPDVSPPSKYDLLSGLLSGQRVVRINKDVVDTGPLLGSRDKFNMDAFMAILIKAAATEEAAAVALEYWSAIMAKTKFRPPVRHSGLRH